MNKPASVELERQNEQRKNMSSKIPKVNKLHTEVQTSEEGQGVAEGRKRMQEQSVVVTSSKDSELYETIRLLREETAELRKSITNPQVPPRHAWMSIGRGCKVCQEQGTDDDCEHCFKYGQSVHVSRGCRGQKGVTRKSDSMSVTIQAVTPKTFSFKPDRPR